MRAFAEVFSILGVAAALPAIAASQSAQMQVSVRVVARTILTVEQQPETIEITASDVARGYLDIPNGVALCIRSNAANGYALRFAAVDTPFARAEITWDNSVFVISNEAVGLAQPYQRGLTSGLMRVRLFLTAATVPGSYPWPIQVVAASL